MKADPPGTDKVPGVGRPRDLRIDAAILRATAELLVEIGYSDLTMAAVAERAGTTKSALYRRWSSKAELAHEASFSLPLSVVASGDMPGSIRAMVAATRDVFTSPVVRAALPGLLADMTDNAELTGLVLGRFEGLFDVLRGWLTQAVDSGDARRGVDADRLVEVIGGATLFALMLHPGADLTEDWVDQTAAIVMHGLMA